jgi:hypothetical protein
MTLTGNSKGSLHPGGNPKSISGQSSTHSTEIYRVPMGRMAYITDIYGGIWVNERQQTGFTNGQNATTQYHPVYVTEGDVVKALSNGSYFFGIEFDI